MQVITLYRYGNTVISPIKPDVEYTTLFRLIADEGKVLTKDNINFVLCADADSIDGWNEVDEEASVEDYQQAL